MEVTLKEGTVFEFDPDKKYLICFNKDAMPEAIFAKLAAVLKLNNGSVAVMINGDPSTAVKVIASTPEPDKDKK